MWQFGGIESAERRGKVMTTERIDHLVFVGAYTETLSFVHGKAEGINAYRLDPETGAMSLARAATGIPNPSFLTLHPTRPLLYAVNEVSAIDGHEGGAVSAFAVDRDTGALTFLNRQSSEGNAPCHVAVDPSGRYALVANFGSGTVAVLPIRDDGSLEPASDVDRHQDSPIDAKRQARKPHAHSVYFDPAGRHVLSCDLGYDRIFVYRLDLDAGRLVPNDPPFVSTDPGAGPRHLEFHPNGHWVYGINERDSTLAIYDYDAANGTLEKVQVVSTLPAGFAGSNTCADVHVAPSGRFVYGSNRGNDSIVVYAIDGTTGQLSYVEHISTRGRTPRGFTIDQRGQLLLVGNQDSDTVVAFRLDETTGRLSPTGSISSVPTPVCLKIAAG
jgi:6-phosphogluconolactonase